VEAVLRGNLGLDPATLGSASIVGAAERRMDELSISDVSAYAALLERDGGEVEVLAGYLLVHETWFFRYPASFELLVTRVRERLAQHDASPVRILSAACSTGEEPASIAMALLDAGIAPPHFALDAVDLSGRAIAYAKEGFYRYSAFRRDAPVLASRHVRREGGGVRLHRSLLDRIRYRTANLLASDFDRDRPPYHVVFCRNLLIYLTADARARVLGGLGRLLDDQGVLFVGHAEVAAVRRGGFAPVPPHDAFACVKRTDVATGRETIEPPREVERSAKAAAPPRARRRVRPRPTPVPVPPTPSPADQAPAPARLAEAARLADGGQTGRALALLLDDAGNGRATADHYHLMAVIHSAAGRARDAEAALVRALYLDPRHYGSLLQCALLAEERGDANRARRFRQRAARAHGGEA
jgi:chemotaxis protein methyltransferase WspC